MAQSENFQSTNQWIANCSDNNGGLDLIKDLDYRVYWGNEGTITIKRHNLIGITYIMKVWNSIDGWIERSHTQTLPQPVEEHTFNNVSDIYAFAKNNTLNYFGKSYIITGILKIKFGDPPGEIEEVYTTTVNGCFRRNDPHYFRFFDCTPPDIPCEEV